MKTINESKYCYSGTFGEFHVFKNRNSSHSDELICVAEACFKKENGKVQYFNRVHDDKICFDLEIFKRK